MSFVPATENARTDLPAKVPVAATVRGCMFDRSAITEPSSISPYQVWMAVLVGSPVWK